MTFFMKLKGYANARRLINFIITSGIQTLIYFLQFCRNKFQNAYTKKMYFNDV